jgi:hypothetical protein
VHLLTQKLEDLDLRWADDGLGALIRSKDDSWIAHLRVEDWYPDQQVEGELAWVASWLDPEAEDPTMLMAAIEQPAMTAEDNRRRRHLVELAMKAMASPPEVPEPFAAPAPTPEGADEWADHLDLQLACWDGAFRELEAACADMDDSGEFGRYRALTQSLDWAYALDSSLGVLWKSLPIEIREEVSKQTDERAREAAEHNANGMLKFDLETDAGFIGYVRRLEDRRPYRHWGEVMLAGIFQARFFKALSWTRGQLIHAATAAPMELRQHRAGVAPRWKWRESESFARGRADDAGLKVYDHVLAGHDVLGLLGNLTDVFHDAGMNLRRHLRSVESGP